MRLVALVFKLRLFTGHAAQRKGHAAAGLPHALLVGVGGRITHVERQVVNGRVEALVGAHRDAFREVLVVGAHDDVVAEAARALERDDAARPIDVALAEHRGAAHAGHGVAVGSNGRQHHQPVAGRYGVAARIHLDLAGVLR